MSNATPDRSAVAKQRIVALIQRIHAHSPNLRFGQIIGNALAYVDQSLETLYYLEDGSVEAALARYCDRYDIPTDGPTVPTVPSSPASPSSV